MIRASDRFVTDGQMYFGDEEDPTTETSCTVWDWDQLRIIKLKGTAKLFSPYQDVEARVLGSFADCLSPEVRAVKVDDEGLIIEVSTDPAEDDTMFIGYLPFSITKSLQDCRTIQRSELREVDRLGPGVDLSLYYDEDFHVSRKVAFKFNPLAKDRRLRMAWNELNAVKSLSHPNIVPFDRVVLDDVESRVIGFTSKYIPGGTLDDTKLPFRLEWLRQLTQLVDYLNLDLGIMHQDISPRNLLIDPQTQNILLFDFDWVANGKNNLLQGRDDVTGIVFTLYELITGDTHFTSVPHWERDISMVQNISDWPCRRELDATVTTFRKVLNEWVSKRRSGTGSDMESYLNAPHRLTWPDLPTPPDYSVPFEHGILPDGGRTMMTGPRTRRTAMEKGQYIFHWERPPQSRLNKSENGVS